MDYIFDKLFVNNNIYDFFLVNSFFMENFHENFTFYLRSLIFLENHIFYYCFFAFLMCLFSTFLILVNNPIYSVINLILVYLSASFMLVFIEIHFLAVLFILVYLGAVVVLFLFIVMMLNIKVMAPLSLFTFIPILFIFLILWIFSTKIDIFFKFHTYLISSFDIETIGFIEAIFFIKLRNLIDDIFYLELLNYRFENYNILAFLLYTHYFVELCMAAFVLLLAMIGCIALTLGNEIPNLKKQDTMHQILHKNIFLLKKKN
jgi:NADH:ubiquinone oxidoreductase subunit 6 (subunit J)